MSWEADGSYLCLPRWSSSTSTGGVCCVKKVLASRNIVAATRRPIGSTSPHMAPPFGFSQQLEERKVTKEACTGDVRGKGDREEETKHNKKVVLF